VKVRGPVRRLLVTCLVGGATSLTGVLAIAPAAHAEARGSRASSFLTEGALRVPALEALDEDQQVTAEAEATLTSPEAIAEREASRTAYEGLSPEQAKQIDGQLFPTLISELDGGPPPPEPGAKAVAFPADNAEQILLPGGEHAAVETTYPMAVQTSETQRTPVDLHLHASGRGFQPLFPLVSVQIPSSISSGVQIPGIGLSLTPVSSDGSAVGGATGEVDGATALYPNTSTDTDTVVKPTTFGFAEDTLLRSVESPRQLYYRVGMPAGAHLEAAPDGSGALAVVAEGATIARIPRPSAQDARGTSVPVSVSVVSGDILALSVAPVAGIYQLPVHVDPSVEDSIWQNEWYYSTYYRTEWHFEHSGSSFLAAAHPEDGEWVETIEGSHSESEWGGLFYTTRGASQIVTSHVEGNWSDKGAHIQNYVILWTSLGNEDYDALPEETERERGWGGYACAPELKCPETTAGGAAPENGNTAAYEQIATPGGTKPYPKGVNTVTKARVTISQEKGPELSFNTSSATIYNEATKEAVPNVLYGSGTWLGPHSGAFEVKAKDPGLGISEYRVLPAADYRFYYANGECIGLQCPEAISQGYGYKSGMPDGETSFEAFVVDPVGLYADIYPQKIKIDATPPHNIKISGFQNGNELPLGETKLKIEATDGEGSTKSSGVKSILATIDGHAVTGSAASCAEGPCTATTEILLSSRDYTSGEHALVVTATDNANNVVQEEFAFRVHGATPLAVGPGSVDSSTGQLTLAASDVSLSGATGVSRTYKSRELTAGAEGPLGPQWAINLGGGEGLSVLTNGNAVLNASGGASTSFARNAKGEYEPPKGDSNLKLEAKEAKAGAGISEYVLTDATAGTKTVFAQPAGSEAKPPTYTGAFGAEAGQLKGPLIDAVDPSGNVWVTNNERDLVEKFSQTGALLATYGSIGSAERQFSGPWGIAVDPRNGNVYVSDQGNNRIQELSSSGAFIKALGWGVGNGKDEFEICTKECKAGLAGSGNGQFGDIAGVSVDSSGNLWVADFGNNRVQEFNEKGEFQRAFGSVGKEAGQLEGPTNIALSGGNLYVTDYRNNRVQEFSTTGTAIRQFGSAGSENGQFKNPYDIATDPRTGNLYVVDEGNERVQEFTPSGVFTTKFGISGSGPGRFKQPTGVAASPSGTIYVVDWGANQLDEWARTAWVPIEAGGPLAASTTTYAYTTVEQEGKAALQPTQALAPIPAGVSSCSPLARGCRALTFKYAEKTTATGESSAEWGEYKGRLTRVYLNAWNPATKAMSETAVAEYAFDKQGRLRAEWDPRITPNLKTTYGYDEEGHVTAVSPPGQQPWLISYGTSEGDAGMGRAASVTRVSPTASLWSGAAPESAALPSITGTYQVGALLTAHNPEWNHSAQTFSYQWQSCAYEGHEEPVACNPIPGAISSTYTPLAADRGRYLTVEVKASNATGTTAVCLGTKGRCVGQHIIEGASELNKEPAAARPATTANSTWTLEYHVPVTGTGAPVALGSKEAEAWGQKDDPVEGTALFPPDEPMAWPAADYTRATTSYFDAEGRMVNTSLPSGGIATSEFNKADDVVRTLSATNRAAALKEGSKSSETAKLLDTQSHYNGETKEEETKEEEEAKAKHRAAPEPGTELLETRGPQHKVKIAENGREVAARNHVKYFYDENAPEGRHYGLVTKTTDGAEYEGKESDVRTTITSYGGQSGLGWTLRKPTSVTLEPAGLNLTTTTVYDELTGNVTEKITPMAAATNVPAVYHSEFGSRGAGAGQFHTPPDVAIDTHGNLWLPDYGNNRVDEFSASGTFIKTIGWGVKSGEHKFETCTASCLGGFSGSGNGQFAGPTGIAFYGGNMYVAEYSNSRIQEFTEAGEYSATFGTKGTGAEQFTHPFGITANPTNGDLWISDDGNQRISEYTPAGKFIETIGFGVSNGEAKFQTCTSGCQAGIAGSGNGQFAERPGFLAFSGTSFYVTDPGNDRVQKFTEKGEYQSQFGSKGTGHGQFQRPVGIAVSANPGIVYVSDTNNARVQAFSTSTSEFQEEFGETGTGAGQFSEPEGIALTASGHLDVIDGSETPRLEEWLPNSPAAHTTKKAYYTAEANAQYPGCGGHAEWASLLCETLPAQQPETKGLPPLPVTTVTYNMWDESETTTETFGSTARTKSETYDAAGRALTSEITAAIDKALPKVTNEYNAQTGALEKQSTTTEGKTRTITSVDNAIGQLTGYTDAAGNTAKYAYDLDGRLEEVSDAKGTQTYAYDPTTGFLTKLLDSAAGTFSASYNAEGSIERETYPNGMTATYSINPVGQPTSVEYVKTTHCAEKCDWFTDSVTPSIHGEALMQASSLATEHYTYDNVGRLTQTQEEPGGKNCVTRLYSYDEEANRTSLTTREPGSEGKCATEGGTTQTHTYDAANRLADPGMVYEEFGNVTTLPAADAGKYALTSKYYVDGQLESQTENGVATTYHYDPVGRTEESTSGSKTSVFNYDGPGEAASWTSEGSSVWTRNIAGIDGAMTAVQSSAGATTLELHDLQGDVVATASLSESETKLLTTYNSTEFGVPQSGTSPPKYSWLGGDGLATTAAPDGAANPGGAAYVPLIGRVLQTQSTASPGAFSDGTTAAGVVQAAYVQTVAGQLKGLAAQHESELDEAARKQSEEEAARTQCPSSACGPWPVEPPPAPAEGGAEEAHFVEQEANEEVSSPGQPIAYAAFDRTFPIPSESAIQLGGAMVATGSEPNSVELSLAGVPTWAYRLLEHITHHSVTKVGGALLLAGSESLFTPEPIVRINIAGSVRYGVYNIQIKWAGVDYYSP